MYTKQRYYTVRLVLRWWFYSGVKYHIFKITIKCLKKKKDQTSCFFWYDTWSTEYYTIQPVRRCESLSAILYVILPLYSHKTSLNSLFFGVLVQRRKVDCHTVRSQTILKINDPFRFDVSIFTAKHWARLRVLTRSISRSTTVLLDLIGGVNKNS